jgi:hypothetical protein
VFDEGIVQAFWKSAHRGDKYDFIELESGRPTMDELYAVLQIAEDEGIIGLTIQNQFIKKVQIETTQIRLFGIAPPTFLHNEIEYSVRSFYSTLHKVAEDIGNIEIEPILTSIDQSFLTIYFKVYRETGRDSQQEPSLNTRASSKNSNSRNLIGKRVKYLLSCNTCPHYEQIIVNKNAPVTHADLPSTTCPECGGCTSLRNRR